MADLLEAMPGGLEAAVRDFGLITLANQLSASFPRQLVFKGGFVLRHVYGLLRFSKDVDATRHEPPLHKLDGDRVAEAISQASIRNIVRFSPDEPKTDSARSLDFDNVAVTGDTFPSTTVQVEVSYRETVVDDPVPALIGAPFYEDFEIQTMAMAEMAAEKLRALAQRLRPTDFADLATMLKRRTRVGRRHCSPCPGEVRARRQGEVQPPRPDRKPNPGHGRQLRHRSARVVP